MTLDHIAIIVSDYQRSLEFYGVFGFREVDRYQREHDILGMWSNGDVMLEMFEKKAPPRVTDPEAMGLRHLAFCVEDLDAEIRNLQTHGIEVEPVRVDMYGRRFTFFKDPDGLPIEMKEQAVRDR